MRIERREHPFHRRIDEIVIARLISIDVILPEQLDRFGKNGNLRVTVVLLRLVLRFFGLPCFFRFRVVQTKGREGEANNYAQN